MSDLENLCKNEDLSKLKYLEKDTKVLLIDASFNSLFLCKGNQRLAKRILSYFKLISIQDLTLTTKIPISLPPFLELKMKGVTTIPIYNDLELLEIKKEFDDTVLNFQEYKRYPNNPEFNLDNEKIKYVLGGAAFLGNPSSFHNETVRKIRLKAQNIVQKTIFKNLLNNLNCDQNIEMLIDRMMVRNPGVKPSPETWHRDVAPTELLLDDDIVYGGWINLDNKDQYFSCIIGSHLGIKLKNLTSGFANIPKTHVKEISKLKSTIKIPPGHLVIFPQYILHEIVSKSNNYTMKRLFIGWRQTFSNNMLFDDFISRLETQSIMRIPSGQEPAMYSKMHCGFHKDLLKVWSDTTIEDRILVQEKDIGICPRFMKSLKEYGFNLYPVYSRDEINKYRPQRILF